jgi:DNA-binding CsgD family transcriptional regulator
VHAADTLTARTDEILKAYKSALRESNSPLIAPPERWDACRSQAKAVLLECAAALRDDIVCYDEARLRTRAIGVARAIQQIPISDSIQAGMLLWSVSVSVLRESLTGESCAESLHLADAMEALHRSIEARMHIGAIAHENCQLSYGIIANNTPSELFTDSAPSFYVSPSAEPGEQDSMSLQGITEREKQVLDGVARALSNREIARELCVGETTIKSHLRKIFRKLGATSRVDALKRAGIYHTSRC